MPGRSMLLLLIVALFPSIAFTAQDHDVQLAPFNAIRWTAATPENPEVRVGEQWFAWLELDGIEVGKIVGFCKARWPGRWRKRVGEDLVEALVRMGEEVGSEVTLEVRELSSGKQQTLEKVPMTAANRRQVLAYNRTSAGTAPPPPRPLVKRVERKHPGDVPEEYSFLTRFLEGLGGPTISRRHAEEDLDQLEWLVQQTHSYRSMRGVDIHAIFDALRLGLDEEQPLNAFAINLSKGIALLGDGHAQVRGLAGHLPEGCLPFLLADSDQGVVAFLPDRSAFVDPERPYVHSIDGRPLEEWLAAVSATVPAASEETTRFRAMRNLRHWNHARLELGLEPAQELSVELEAAGGLRRREVALPLAGQKPIYGPWPRSETALLEGDVGYLRIPSMDSSADFVDGLATALRAFAGTKSLVIDVRGNGGGSRDALHALLPRLLEPGEAQRIVNVAAYRFRPGEKSGRPGGYLENRALFPATAGIWKSIERSAIEALSEGFTPDWSLPEGEFSEWLGRFVYGLPETRREELRGARYASGVGCNATAVILALHPLARCGVIDHAVVEVKVGSSEGGNRSNPSTHHAERSGVVRSFAPTGHRHQAEMQQELGATELYFSATAVELVRGILCTAHVFLSSDELEERDLWRLYREFYESEPFVRLVKERQGLYRYPEPKILAGTNWCDVGFARETGTNRVVVISAIDNLMKGAAGSAVQAMNLMCGFDESLGLSFPGLHPC